MFIILVCSLLLSACGAAQNQEKLIEKYTNIHSKFILLDGNRVHYRDEGQGEVIVLLHGTASSLHTWDQWVLGLSKQYRIIRMDLPGFGLTGPDQNNRYEVEDDIAFLNKFLARLGLNKVHLVGSSLGGRIAWEYSLAYPGQLESLTLMNALGYPQERWPPAIEIAQWPLMDKIMAHFSPRFLYETGLKEVYFNAKQVTSEVVDRYYELSRYSGNLDAFPRRVKARLDTEANKIAKISVPTLILWGREDIYFPVENAFRFHQDIKHSSMNVYSGVGHLPMEEASSRSLSDFLKFIHASVN
jgi:pimeloyl-ACP methyl ester carboxylesterase